MVERKSSSERNSGLGQFEVPDTSPKQTESTRITTERLGKGAGDSPGAGGGGGAPRYSCCSRTARTMSRVSASDATIGRGRDSNSCQRSRAWSQTNGADVSAAPIAPIPTTQERSRRTPNSRGAAGRSDGSISPFRNLVSGTRDREPDSTTAFPLERPSAIGQAPAALQAQPQNRLLPYERGILASTFAMRALHHKRLRGLHRTSPTNGWRCRPLIAQTMHIRPPRRLPCRTPPLIRGAGGKGYELGKSNHGALP